MPNSYHIIFNARSGTAQAQGLTPAALRELFERHGHEPVIDEDVDTPLAERVEAAVRSDARVIVAAGGDGTATAVAEALAGTDKVLAILPLGTANLLARDLSIPLQVPEWFAALDTMVPRRIDVGVVNGRIFLHKVVIGLIPGIAAGREALRGRAGLVAWIGFLRYFFRRLLRARRLAVEITPAEGEPHIERVKSIAVANNAYDEGFARFFARRRLDTGTLTLYLLKHLTIGDFFRLLIEKLIGNWRQDEALSILSVKAVTLRSRHRRLMAMIDGEVRKMDVPLEFSIRPGALAVLSPDVTQLLSETAEPRVAAQEI